MANIKEVISSRIVKNSLKSAYLWENFDILKQTLLRKISLIIILEKCDAEGLIRLLGSRLNSFQRILLIQNYQLNHAVSQILAYLDIKKPINVSAKDRMH